MRERMLQWLIQRASRRGGAQARPAAFPPGGFVAFVTYVDSAQRVTPEHRLYSKLASARLRVLIPAQQLAQHVPVWLVSPEELASRPDLAHLGRPGAIVLGKLAAKDVVQKQDVLRQVLRNFECGTCPAALYADLSDDYAALGKEMGRRFLREYQKALAKWATLIVPCAELQRSLSRYARRGITVIEDPYEDDRAQPVQVAASSPLRLAWFGSLGPLNIPVLEQAFDAIAAGMNGMAIGLETVTANDSREALESMAARLRARYPAFELTFTPWSLASAWAAIQRSDFVLLPQDYRSGWGKVKSHNRMVSAIRGGRFAIASPIPAYQELSQYAWVGKDLSAGLRWAMAHPGEAARRVEAGQRYVEARFAPDAVGRKWVEALGIRLERAA
jgi:hypothetical protein